MMDRATFHAFSAELRGKFAEATPKNQKELEAALEPGDILVTSSGPSHSSGGIIGEIADRVLKFGIRNVYGDAGHAAIYVGDGKAVEMTGKLRQHRLAKAPQAPPGEAQGGGEVPQEDREG
jgi:cell wall-associated NlpC family hydrolase